MQNNEEEMLEWLSTIKKLNQFTKTNNYFLPNKEVLINLVKNKNSFQNLIANLIFGRLEWKKQVLNTSRFL